MTRGTEGLESERPREVRISEEEIEIRPQKPRRVEEGGLGIMLQTVGTERQKAKPTEPTL
jgi:hypothetical protein